MTNRYSPRQSAVLTTCMRPCQAIISVPFINVPFPATGKLNNYLFLLKPQLKERREHISANSVNCNLIAVLPLI